MTFFEKCTEYIEACIWLKEAEDFANKETIRQRWIFRDRDHEIIATYTQARSIEKKLYNELLGAYNEQNDSSVESQGNTA